MLLKYVTLCLLITYHWLGSSAGSTRVWPVLAATTVTAGIAVEANGSSTDARSNIPVVKRSSNQAGFANELRSPVEKRVRIVEVMPPLFELQHEYANRNEEKYSTEKLAATKKLVESSVVRERIEEGAKEKVMEKGKVFHGIKSSIPAKDAIPPKARLIGKANSPPGISNLRHRFDYERASTRALKLEEKRSDEERTDSGEATKVMKEKKKVISGNKEENNGEAIVSSVFAFDAFDSGIHRIGREAEVKRELEKDERNSLLSGIGTIDSEPEKQWKQQQEDYDASRVSNRLFSLSSSSSLKLMEQPLPEKSKLIETTGESKKIFHSRRLHQQSRNTKPQNFIQRIRRKIKRETSFDDNVSPRISSFVDNRNMGSDLFPPACKRNQRQVNHREIPNSPSLPASSEPELRFIPNNHRSGNRIYFQRTLKHLSPSRDFREDSNGAHPFVLNSETNSQKIPRFDAVQIENLRNSIKGVFEKHEARQQGQNNILPNVRMIQPRKIFVVPPRLIYDTKILPAPFSLNPYFQNPSDNINDDNDYKPRNYPSMEAGSAIKGVFDQSHKEAVLDQREVIPVREDSPPSLTSTRNFVTPLPPYRVEEGGEVSVRVNQPAEDPNVPNEIYQVRELGISEMGNESQRDEEDEDSRLNHESLPIEVGVEHHLEANYGLDGRGSSYDNLAGTSANRGKSGSTNVDNSDVTEGITDEYVNRSPTIPNGIQSIAKSKDNTDDKSRDDNDHNRYTANYSFDYRVSDYKTENEFGHQESRNEGITKGKYHVRLPDGRIQKVNYYVDDEGYHALVSYHNDEIE